MDEAEPQAVEKSTLDLLLAKFGDFDPQADDAAKLAWFEAFARLMVASGVGPAADTVFYDEDEMDIAKACAFQDGFNFGLKAHLNHLSEVATLTPEQRAMAYAYNGSEAMGDPAYRRK